MKTARSIPMVASIFAVLLLLTLTLAGCAQGEVIWLSNSDVAALTADDIVCVMRRAGFSNEQILDLGTDLRNALVSAGAAKIRIGKKVEAIFALNGDYLYTSSYQRGSFIYDVQKHEFR